MKHMKATITLLLLGGLFLHQHAQAQYKVPFSVVGSGGAVLTSGSYRTVGTVGQPVIGVTNSPANSSYFGFWYLPNRLTTGVEQQAGTELPTEYRLEQNYPNPFNPATTIVFALPSRQVVTLKVYDILGRDVAVLINEVKEPGRYTVSFDASGLTSGVYFYRLQAGGYVATKKLTVLK